MPSSAIRRAPAGSLRPPGPRRRRSAKLLPAPGADGPAAGAVGAAHPGHLHPPRRVSPARGPRPASSPRPARPPTSRSCAFVFAKDFSFGAGLLRLRLPRRRGPLTAARLASSAAMRSGTLVGCGASGCTAISSPAALRSISSSTFSRYSSWYLSGSHSVDSESMSCWAIVSSRSEALSSLASGRSSIAVGRRPRRRRSSSPSSARRPPGGSRRAAPSSAARPWRSRPCRTRASRRAAARRPSPRPCPGRGSTGGRRRSGRSPRGRRSPRCRSCASSRGRATSSSSGVIDDVAVLRELVALDDVLVGDLLAGHGVDALLRRCGRRSRALSWWKRTVLRHTAE